MIVRHRIVAIALAVALAATASANMVYFPDSTAVDGVVTHPNPNCIQIESGGGKTLVHANRIERSRRTTR